MILSAIIMIFLAVILLAYILEPVLKADVDQVEIDAIADTPELPDFRAFIADDEAQVEQDQDEESHAMQDPEPAKHRP